MLPHDDTTSRRLSRRDRASRRSMIADERIGARVSRTRTSANPFRSSRGTPRGSSATAKGVPLPPKRAVMGGKHWTSVATLRVRRRLGALVATPPISGGSGGTSGMARRSTIVAVAAALLCGVACERPRGQRAAARLRSPARRTRYRSRCAGHRRPTCSTSRRPCCRRPAHAPRRPRRPCRSLLSATRRARSAWAGWPTAPTASPIRATDLAGAAADSPGATVVVDTVSPTASLLVAGQAGGSVSGVVSLSATAPMRCRGSRASVVHVGAVGACSAGAVLGAPGTPPPTATAPTTCATS